MSEYQLLKARALAAQQEREKEIQYEIEAKAARLKAQRKEEEERRKRQEAASKEARTLELKRANEAINKGREDIKREEYNPFAEPERPVASSSTNYKSNKPIPSRTVRAIHSSSKDDIPRPPAVIPKSPKKNVAKSKEKESSPPALGRKEKAARALLESAKRGGATSIFSVKSNNPPPQRVVSNSSGIGKGKGKGKEVRDMDMRALCPDRGSRDNRTIDQIQKDIKARKAGVGAGGVKEGKWSRSPDKSKPPTNNNRLPIRPNPVSSSSSRRRPSPTPSTSTSSSEDVAPRKRVKPDEDRTKVSAMIQEMFRRPGGRPNARREAYSDSESDDMEAGLSDVEEEEQRAVRIARREDELAEREERERKAKKERLKKERGER